MPDAPPPEPPEFLLRRLPDREGRPSAEPAAGGGLRPSSDRMTIREKDGERYLSCCSLAVISPLDLLEVEATRRSRGGEPVTAEDLLDRGWRVCLFAASDLLAIPDPDGGPLRLAYEHDDDLPGHYGVHGADGRPFPNRRAKKLAKTAFVLTAEQTRTIPAGPVTPAEVAAWREAARAKPLTGNPAPPAGP